MWCCRNHLWKVTQHKMYSRDVDRWRSRVKAAVKGKLHQCQAKSSSSAANMQQCRVWIGQELLWHTCGHVSCLCLCFTSPRLISSLLFCFFFLSWSFEFWKDELVLSSLSLHFLGVRDGLSFSGFGGETAGADMSETKARECCCYVGNTMWFVSMDVHKQKEERLKSV